MIPSNVARAANLFQRNGWFIRGEPEIRADDPARTTIIGNFKYDYSSQTDRRLDSSIYEKGIQGRHTRMEYDPDVWTKVEELILDSIRSCDRKPLEALSLLVRKS